MALIIGVTVLVMLVATALPGLLVAVLGLRSLWDERVLRSRGVRVHGVAERRVRRFRTSIVYRFQDQAGQPGSGVSNTLAALARPGTTEVGLWYDPRQTTRVREELRTPFQTLLTLTVVAVALAWVWAFGSMVYGLLTSSWDMGG